MSQEIEREIHDFLKSEWQRDYEISRTGSGHIKVVLQTEKGQQTTFWPSTPSDHRSLLNSRAQTKRAMRELIGIIPAEPKKTSKKKKHRKRGVKQPLNLFVPRAEKEKRVFSIPVQENERKVKILHWKIEPRLKPTLTRLQLAAALDVSGARVSQMVSSGFLNGTYCGEGKDRRFDLKAVIKRREEHFQKLAEQNGIELDDLEK